LPIEKGLLEMGLNNIRIADVRATPVSVPLKRVALMAQGAVQHTSRTIIEVETNNGIIGLGEAAYGETAQIISRFRERILGLNPCEMETIRRYCLPDHLDRGTPLLQLRLAAWGGVEIALWDILGKVLGLPLSKLLGGPVRRRAPFVAYAYTVNSPEKTAECMASIADSLVSETGASLFEFKVAHHPLDVDIDTVRMVKAAIGSRAKIAVDANQGWTLSEARSFLEAIGPGVLSNVEEPTPSLSEAERLYEEFHVPMSTHVSELEILLGHPKIEGVVPTLDVVGGIGAFRRLCWTLSAIGRRCWLRSHMELGIGWAAMVHLGTAIPELDRPGQALINLVESDLTLGPRWLVRDGGVCPPERPGLGVELDYTALMKYADYHKQVGDCELWAPPLTAALEVEKP
jgi:glucarate dehydratase